VDAFVARLRRVDARAQMDRLVAAGDALLERPDQVGVAAREELVHELDDGHPAAECLVDRRHLQADDPAADDEQPLGQVGEREGAVGGHDARVVLEAGDGRRRRAGRHDAPPEGDGLVADRELARPGEARLAADDLDLTPGGQLRESAREPVDRALLERTHALEVDRRRAEGDALGFGVAGVGEHLGDVQQRLGGDAPDVQAHAPEALVALDEDDLEAEVRGAERGGVAARPGADDDHVGVHSRALRRSPSTPARWTQKRAPSAPSITRWS
jgi:hypothetical protein